MHKTWAGSRNLYYPHGKYPEKLGDNTSTSSAKPPSCGRWQKGNRIGWDMLDTWEKELQELAKESGPLWTASLKHDR